MNADVKTEKRKVPSIAELRRISQQSKTDQRWFYVVFRQASVYLTWLLLHTPISANQMTVVSIATGIAGLLLMARPAPELAVIGCAVMFLYILLDKVDGEIARYRNTFSLHGIYLDNVGHYITSAGVVLAATFRLAPASSNGQLVWLFGSLGVIAVMLSRIEKHAPFHLFSQHILKQPQLLKTLKSSGSSLTRHATKADRGENTRTQKAYSTTRVIRNVLLMLTSFPVMTLLLTAGFTMEVVTKNSLPATVALIVVVATQVIAYLGVEYANLTQNLSAESKRLAKMAGLDDESGIDHNSE